MVAAQTQDELRARLAGAREGRSSSWPRPMFPAPPSCFARLSGVGAVAALGETRLAVTPASGAPDDDDPLREAVFRAAVAGGLVLRELRLEAASLEELFARATSATGERSA